MTNDQKVFLLKFYHLYCIATHSINWIHQCHSVTSILLQLKVVPEYQNFKLVRAPRYRNVSVWEQQNTRDLKRKLLRIDYLTTDTRDIVHRIVYGVIVLQQNQGHVAASWVQCHPGLHWSLDFTYKWVYLITPVYKLWGLFEYRLYYREKATCADLSVTDDLHGISLCPQSQQPRC